MKSTSWQPNKISSVLLIFILMVQIVSLIMVGFDKTGFHIDETYTFILSNSYDTNRISHDTQAMTSWNEGSYFDKFTTVNDGEDFAYNKVKLNNSLDAHPPLYYYFIHTISSFFPEASNRWIGLIFNYILFIGIQLLLYLLTTKITNNSFCGLSVIALNGGLTAVLDMTMFIRMYSLLTFFALLSMYIHYLIYLNPQKKQFYIYASIITFLGIYTQYYFAFFAFFIAAIYCLWLLKNHNYKMLILYSLLMLISVAAVFIIYPAAISQITGSETNNIGKEVSKNIFNFMALPAALVNMGKQFFIGFFSSFYNYIILSVLCVFITILFSFLLRNKTSYKNNENNNIGKVLIILAIVIVLTIISITHISGKFTYLRYIYYLFPLCSLFVLLFILFIGAKIRLNLNVLCTGIICFGLIGTISFVKNDLCTYTFQEKHENEMHIIEQCQDKPLVLISNGTTYHPTANYDVLRNASDVYICNFKNDTDIDKILQEKKTDNGVVFMVLTDRYWSNGFDGNNVMKKIIDNSNLLDNFEYCGNTTFSSNYIAR